MKLKHKLVGILAAVLLASGMTVPARAASFDDTVGHWGESAIERWGGHGIVQGSGGQYRPDDKMTRAELAAVVSRLLGLKEKSENTFDDLNENAWYADAMLKCAKAGIIKGDGKGVNPNDTVTRQESAVILARALGIKPAEGSLSFDDGAQVADWASGYIKAMIDKKIINGMGDNSFAPLTDINRAAVVTILDKSISGYANTSGATLEAKSEGITLVAAPDVIITGAAEDVLVAAGAEGSTVTVENATVTGTVTVAAPKTTVTLAGVSKVETVAVTETAEAAKVTVEKSAAAGEIKTEAPNTGVTVSGKVESVTVGNAAADTKVQANSGSTITSVDNKAEGTTISGSGKVESVITSGNNTTVNTGGTRVEATEGTTGTTAGGKQIAAGENTTTKPSVPSGGSSGGGSSGGGSSGGGGGSSVPVVSPAPAFNALELDTETFSGKANAFSTEYYNKDEGSSLVLEEDKWFFTLPAAVSADYISKVTSVSLGGAALNSGDVRISVGNSNFVEGKLYRVDADGLKVALPVVALEAPNENSQLVFTIKASGYADATAIITVPELKAITGSSAAVQNSDMLQVTGSDNCYDIEFLKYRAPNTWRHMVKFSLNGSEANFTADTIYFTKKDTGSSVTYGFTKAESDGTLGLYPPAAENGISGYKYTVATADRYGAVTMTLNIGANKIPKLTDVTVSAQDITDKTAYFANNYYNKCEQNSNAWFPTDDETYRSNMYFTLPGTNLDEAYCNAVTELSVNGNALAKDSAYISVGNNAFRWFNVWELTTDGLKVSLPMVALEMPVDGKLSFTVKADGYEDVTAVINVPPMKGINCDSIQTTDAQGNKITVGALENNACTVTVPSSGYDNYNSWKDYLLFSFTGDDFNANDDTIYFTKKVQGSSTSYGFTMAEKNTDGKLGLYPPLVQETLYYTVASSNRYGATTLTLNISVASEQESSADAEAVSGFRYDPVL